MLFRKAPDFSLRDDAGETVDLARFRGRYLVLYFYPRAMTQGCTQEALDFSRLLPEFHGLRAEVVGISPDPPERLAKFREKHDLPIALLSDPELATASAYGAIRDGRLLRSTFIIDCTQTVRWYRRGVKVPGHAEEVLEVLRGIVAADEGIIPALRFRRAYRALAPEPVPRELVVRLLEAAHLAPSCFNNQPWRFVVAEGESLAAVKEALSGGNYWVKQAPVIIAVASKPDLDCQLSDGRDYFLFGCGMAVGNLMAQATQMGLIAHPIAGFDPQKVKEALRIPGDYVLITLIVVGQHGDPGLLSDKHRAREFGPRERKSLSEVAFWGYFGKEGGSNGERGPEGDRGAA